jgi:Ni/Fe-hydrogenase subunit HybB-like protein
MDAMVSPFFGLVVALSIGIPFLFVLGARYVAYRVAGRPESLHMPAADVFTVPRFASRWQALRTLALVTVLGIGTGLILLRYVYGIGEVTNLSNRFPWGLWIGFDVMGGVALAAGAFVIAAMAHIFGLKRFEPLVRPAILTGLLGYLLVIAGLMVDLGRPYNVWRPLVHWQHYSVMWEVGMCVASYTTVLFIEFLPVILERVNRFRPVAKRLPTVPLYKLLKKISIVFVILGVVLSTLHQSSLGSLWVIVPTKLSPLWYSLY